MPGTVDIAPVGEVRSATPAKHALRLLPIVFLVAACAPGAPPSTSLSPPVIQTQAVTPVAVTVTLRATAPPPTAPPVEPSLTHTSVAPQAGRPPPLGQVILSAADLEALDPHGANPLRVITDSTHELRDACLRECAKRRYALEEGILTIALLRAGDPGKARGSLQNLREAFLGTAGYEYTARELSGLPPEVWVLSDAPSYRRDFRTGAAGTAHGSVVVLVTYSQDFCGYMPGVGRWCEGDAMDLAVTALDYLVAQVRVLADSGYPK